MSHYTTLVIGEDPEELLAPYDENLQVEPYRQHEEGKPSEHWAFDDLTRDGLSADAGWRDFVQAWNARYDDEPMEYDAERDQAYTVSTYNPKSKWDWYLLGGRWTGYYMLRGPSRLDRDHVRVGSPGLMTAPARPGTADQARKADIDFDGMRALAEAEAISEHAKVTEILRGLPVPTRWSLVRDACDNIDEARTFYHAQPGVRALREGGMDVFGDPVETFFLDEADPAAAYVARRVAGAGVPFAVLTADGWAEEGHMGWRAIVADEDADWTTTARRIIDAAPDSALFSIYDLHI